MKLSREKLKNLLSPVKPYDDRKGNFIINCPKCGHRECSISYTKENNLWGCFRKKECGITGNIFTIAHLLNLPLSEDEKQINIFEDKLGEINHDSFINEQNSVSLEEAKLPIGYKRINDSEYLNGRGFTKHDYLLWEVGKSSLFMKDYVIFPVYQEKLCAYVGRLDKELEDKPKYKNSISDFSKIIGGYDKITNNTEAAFLCEGYLDIINVSRILDLLENEEIRALCTFGAKISEEQLHLLRKTNIKTIYLLFDGDVPTIVKNVGFRLASYFNVLVMTIEGDNDAGDCSIEQLNDAVSNARTPLDFSLNMLG